LLRGDGGNNALRGGLGSDTLDGGPGGTDFADYSDASIGITVSLANPLANTGEAVGDVYLSIEALRGSNNNDRLIGDAQDNFLQGALGADTLDGAAGADYADYFNATAGLTADLSNSVNNTGEAAGDTYISIERLRGSAFNDLLRGDANGNTLRGGGADTLDGGGGGDFASYADATIGITANLANPLANTGEASGDVYLAIESLRGSNNNDQLIGDAQDNFLQEGPGADTLEGGGGDDHADYFVVREVRSSHCPIVINVSEVRRRVARFPHYGVDFLANDDAGFPVSANHDCVCPSHLGRCRCGLASSREGRRICFGRGSIRSST
jgi:Ca2+-binding RTX toxin-like protein